MVDHYKVWIITKIFEPAISFALSFASLHVHKLHKKINDKIAQNNAKYKLGIDVKQTI